MKLFNRFFCQPPHSSMISIFRWTITELNKCNERMRNKTVWSNEACLEQCQENIRKLSETLKTSVEAKKWWKSARSLILQIEQKVAKLLIDEDQENFDSARRQLRIERKSIRLLIENANSWLRITETKWSTTCVQTFSGYIKNLEHTMILIPKIEQIHARVNDNIFRLAEGCQHKNTRKRAQRYQNELICARGLIIDRAEYLLTTLLFKIDQRPQELPSNPTETRDLAIIVFSLYLIFLIIDSLNLLSQ